MSVIRRIWRSYTTPTNADAYEHLLETLMFPAIEGLRLPGYQNMELLRRVTGGEVEFIWVMTFDSTKRLAPLRAEANDPVSVPRAAQQLLTRWDERASFYEMRKPRPAN
jgi:antibiotic biosynthesis monooxygenase (ABM) superfamily enzyme